MSESQAALTGVWSSLTTKEVHDAMRRGHSMKLINKPLYIMLHPDPLRRKGMKEYIEDANLDENSVGRIVDSDELVYLIKWIDKLGFIREEETSRKLVDGTTDNFIFVDAKKIQENIKKRLSEEEEEPLEQQLPSLADQVGSMHITDSIPFPPKGGKKSRKNRKSVKVCKSRKLYKKFCKSRKLRKSRNVRKTRRRWIYMRCDGVERKCFN